MKITPTLDADAIRFLALDKMSAEDFQQLEKELCDDVAPLPLGPLTNEERAENFAELLELFGVEVETDGATATVENFTLEFLGGRIVSLNGQNFLFSPAVVYLLREIGRAQDIEAVLIDSKAFDW